MATDISGHARIIDGDTIDIAGERIRLDGIDAPEMDQACAPGRRMVGHEARRRLADIANGRTVHCARRGLDRYGRTLANCRVGATDVAADLVRAGWAWDYARYSNGGVSLFRNDRPAPNVWVYGPSPANRPGCGGAKGAASTPNLMENNVFTDVNFRLTGES